MSIETAEYFANFFRSAKAQYANQQQAYADEEEEEELDEEDVRGEHPDPDATFGDVFEDLLRPEVQRVLPMWTWLGGASGAVYVSPLLFVIWAQLMGL